MKKVSLRDNPSKPQKVANPFTKTPAKMDPITMKLKNGQKEKNNMKLFLKDEKIIQKDLPQVKDNSEIVHSNNNIATQNWLEIRKKWLQKTNKSTDVSKVDIKKDISMTEYAEIERVIRSITPPYAAFNKPIRLSDMVEILDDIWEEDEE